MQLKTCVHAKLDSKSLNHITLMDSNLSLQYFNLLGNPPKINDSPLPTNLLTLAGQIVTSINNASLNNIPTLTLASGDIKGDCVGSRSGQAIANFDNPSVTNGESTGTWIISFYVTADYNVGGGGGGSSIDYTNVLTNINNNLSALVSKNNQSEITQKLSDIFEYKLANDKYVSCIKDSTVNSDPEKPYANLVYQVLRLLQFFSSSNNFILNYGYSQRTSRGGLIFNEISSKLSESISNVDVPLLKEIALAISSLASASDNQAIKALKDTISALELKVNVDNALLVDGTQEFKIRPFGKNYIDDEDESYS